MTAADLLQRLRDLDVAVTAADGQLRVTGPADAVTPELRQALVDQKPALLRILTSASASRTGEEPAIARGLGDGSLSSAQRRLWFLEQLQQGEPTLNIPQTLRLRGALRVDLLQRSLSALVARHAALRTVFEVDDGVPVQRVRAAEPVVLPVTDLSAEEETAREATLTAQLLAHASTPMDLVRGPIFKAHLWRLAPDDHVLQWLVHHIAADGWSLSLMGRELSALYDAALTGREAALPEPAIEYVDAAVWERTWLRSEACEDHLAYWRRELAGAPERLDLPVARPRPLAPSYRGGMVWKWVPHALDERLLDVVRREQVTPFAMLLGAWAALLHRYSREPELVVGTPVANRTRVELEHVVGVFVNMLPIRIDLGDNPAFRDLAARIHATTMRGVSHQQVPFERIVEDLRPKRTPGVSPVFQIVFSYLDDRDTVAHFSGTSVESLPVASPNAKYDITFYALRRAEGLQLGLEFATDLFDTDTAERLMAAYLRVLEGAVADLSARVGDVPLLGPVEHDEAIHGLNRDDRHPPPRPLPFDADATLPAAVEAWAARTPDAVAVRHEGAAVTYGQLNRQANRIARRLRDAGIGAEVLVGLCLDRTPRLLAALLGVLKAGGAYLPIDLAYPAERLSFMLADAGAAVLLSERQVAGRLPAGVPPVILVEDLLEGPESAADATDLPPAAGPDDLAYIIYTSGTTGRPKGSQISHRNVLALMGGLDRLFEPAPSDVWTLFHSVAFDFSVWEMWGALLNGGTLVVVPLDVARSPDRFYELVARERVTILSQTPSSFRQFEQAEALVGRQPLALRWVVLGGEALDPRALAPWFERHGDAAPAIVNMYGITETTVHVSYRPMTVADVGGPSVIGGPIPHWQMYVVDAYGHPAPTGVPGELYVGGAGVSRGYLNRDDLTRAKFVDNPFDDRSPRLYRSGDLARRLPGGDVEYLGRLDQQVKIRGFRVEIGEVEAVLHKHPAVRSAAVIARPDAQGQTMLAGFVVTEAGAAPSAEDLRAHLRDSVPDYMVPASFTVLDALPLTTNGKLDVDALRKIGPTRASVPPPRTAPETDTERRLAAIWRELLDVPQVGRGDEFFDIGGHSLLALELMSRVHREFGVVLPPGALFAHPVLEDLAAYVAAARPVETASRNGDPAAVAAPAAAEATILRRLEAGRADGAPFFWVHGIGGEVFGFLNLARELATDRPVYGFAADLTRLAPEHSASLETVAARYVDEMRGIQPSGPYHLGAFCSGCPLMLAMARRLDELGECTGVIAAIDYDLRPVETSPRGLAAVRPFATNLGRWVRDDAIPSGWRDLAGRLVSGLRRVTGRGRRAADATTDIRDRLGMWRFPDYSVPMLEAHQRLIEEHEMRPVRGGVTLFVPRAEPLIGPWRRGPFARWEALAGGGLVVYPVPGSHSTVLTQRFVRQWAPVLTRILAAADTASGHRVSHPGTDTDAAVARCVGSGVASSA